MELPKWGAETEVSRFSVVSSASTMKALSHLGAAADGIVVPSDIDAYDCNNLKPVSGAQAPVTSSEALSLNGLRDRPWSRTETRFESSSHPSISGPVKVAIALRICLHDGYDA